MVGDGVDVTESDAMLERSLDPARGGKGGKSNRAGRSLPRPSAEGGRPDNGGSVAPPLAPDGHMDTFQEARTQREKYAAKLVRAEYELKIGLLIEADAATRATTEAYAKVRRSLQRLPEVVAARVAVETTASKCAAIIRTEVESILSALADEIEQQRPT